MSGNKSSNNTPKIVDLGQVTRTDISFPTEKQGGVKPQNTGVSRPPDPQGSGGSSAGNGKK